MATESASAIGHASSWGYACFLTVNATSVWGGIFPFLPLEFQTVEVTLTFFLTQAVAFGGAFLASMLGSYFFPYGARRMLVSLSAVLLFLGSACLITAMYVASAAIAFVGAGGVLLGIGCAGMFMLFFLYLLALCLDSYSSPLAIFLPEAGLLIQYCSQYLQLLLILFLRKNIPEFHHMFYHLLPFYWPNTD